MTPVQSAVDSEDKTFVFTVETDGAYSGQDMVLSAAKSIKGKADQLSQIMDAF